MIVCYRNYIRLIILYNLQNIFYKLAAYFFVFSYQRTDLEFYQPKILSTVFLIEQVKNQYFDCPIFQFQIINIKRCPRLNLKMRNKIIKNIDLKEPQKIIKDPTTITHQKSTSTLEQNSKKNDVKEIQKPKNRLSRSKQLSSSLIASRSNPALLTSSNYIKLEQVDPKNLEQVFSRFTSTNSKLHKLKSMEDIMEINRKPSVIAERQTADGVFKKPKFIRRNAEPKQIEIFSPLANNSINLNDSVKSFDDLIQQNMNLKKRVKDLQIKLEELSNKTKTLNPQNYIERIKQLQNSLKQCQLKINQKNQEIKQLQLKVSVCEDQKKLTTKKLQQLMSQQQLFQRDTCSLNLDDSGIMGADMMSTAQYIESLTDLEDQLHQRKTEIFDLNKMIDQLQMKHHFAQLRNQQTLQRVNLQWQTKYKRLMQMYKTLKSTRTENSKMKKLKTKTQYIECERSSIFNLSISTDRSQLPF